MFGCQCWCWDGVEEEDLYSSKTDPFSLPSPLPDWPQGQGFATGRICLGEIEVHKITEFESIWTCNSLQKKASNITFYRPAKIPDGYFCLGHYCQPNDRPLRGYLLVARDLGNEFPALKQPLDYSLVWKTESDINGCGYIWQAIPPDGYKVMGFLVTDRPDKPRPDDIRCVRKDLTEKCEAYDTILGIDSKSSNKQLLVCNVRPQKRGMFRRGTSVGTFICGTNTGSEEDVLDIACLKNLDQNLHAMPNLDQIHALIQHYGPTVYFHPGEAFLPSSVSWFFKNGALLYKDGNKKGEPIDYLGSNLPNGGENDSEYWIDLPVDDDARTYLKRGNLESSELYVHVKPALGGTFTDIAMWVFCPFNGPATLKIGLLTVAMTKIGEHVGDWEHFTLRISNFNGELWQVFFSEHSGGRWVNASELEFISGNKAIVYSSKNGHASFPHPGIYLQGSSKLGVGVRNDVAKSKFYVDSSTKYRIVAAEYLGKEVIEEPCWLQYMREWGPTIMYDSRTEVDKIIDLLPVFVRFSVETLFELFPTELYGEEGPTGPKEKDNWEGDEIC